MFRTFLTRKLSTGNLYQTLGVPKNSTQAQIKSAFYNLSKIYHPDRNSGCKKAAKRFRDVAAAYEILGNRKKREVYDGQAGNVNPKFEKTKNECKYDHRHYNVDEWLRQHYSERFKQQRKKRKMDESRDNVIEGASRPLFFGVFVLFFIALYF